MRSSLLCTLCSLFLTVESAFALPKTLTATQLVDICSSSTVSDAAAKGDQLSWQRMSDADFNEWRTGFLAYNGGSVDIVGWQHGQGEHVVSLSFWIAQGPNSHKACNYSLGSDAGLLGGLTEILGAPETVEGMAGNAYWKTELMEVYYTQGGASRLVNISYKK